MAVCETCEHEYLDSYEECPFCARRDADRARLDEYVYRVHTRHIPPLLVALLTMLAGAMGVIVYLAAMSVLGANVAPKATLFAQRQACYLTQENAEGAGRVFAASSGSVAANIAELSDFGLSKPPSCPAGGTYTWDIAGGRLVCSVHGWHGDASR